MLIYFQDTLITYALLSKHTLRCMMHMREERNKLPVVFSAEFRAKGYITKKSNLRLNRAKQPLSVQRKRERKSVFVSLATCILLVFRRTWVSIDM